MTEGPDLVVVGAGIAGLVVAWEAARAGRRVVVLEAADRVGGLVARGDLDGVAVDLGAESFALRTTGVADLVRDLPDTAGLGLRIIDPAPDGAHLAVVDEGAADAAEGAERAQRIPNRVLRAPLPRRTVLGIPADPHADDVVRLLGAAAADRAAAERRLPPFTLPEPAAEPSLFDLVAERCGTVLAERLVDPLCRSVYSTPAAEARLSRVQPALWRELIARGSLLEAAAAVAGDARAGAAVGGIDGGMWRLADTLHEAAVQAGADVRPGVAVRAVTADRAAGDVVVTTAAGGLRAPVAVIATGPAAAHALLSGSAPARSAAVRVVAALLNAPALDARPVGTGVIVAPGVPSAAKALTHTTAKWQATTTATTAATSGHHVVRLSARDADAPGLDTPEEIAREIALLTGIPLRPDQVVAIDSVVWADAAATRPLDPDVVAAAARDGIHLAGAVAAGTGLASVVPHARALAARLVAASAPAASFDPLSAPDPARSLA